MGCSRGKDMLSFETSVHQDITWDGLHILAACNSSISTVFTDFTGFGLAIAPCSLLTLTGLDSEAAHVHMMACLRGAIQGAL